VQDLEKLVDDGVVHIRIIHAHMMVLLLMTVICFTSSKESPRLGERPAEGGYGTP